MARVKRAVVNPLGKGVFFEIKLTGFVIMAEKSIAGQKRPAKAQPIARCKAQKEGYQKKIAEL